MSKLTKRVARIERSKTRKLTHFKVDVLSTAIILILIMTGVIYYVYAMTSSGDKVLDNLVERVDGLGRFVDPLNEVAVSTVKDTGYYYKDGKVFIIYGKFKMSLPEDLRKTELDKLKLIGITVTRNEGGKYVFKYRGEIMPEVKTTK